MSRDTWIITATGWPWYFEGATPDEVRIEDIAHALANICRYGGHCREFYSVAEHSVHVSMNLPQELQLEGLLHDATEAYIGDMVRPLKHGPLSRFKEIEAQTRLVVAERFGLKPEVPDEVDRVDKAMLFVERDQIMPKMRHAWMQREWGMGAEPDPTVTAEIRCWVPRIACAAFLRRFALLTRKAA